MTTLTILKRSAAACLALGLLFSAAPLVAQDEAAGDAERGEEVFQTCGACHGTMGQGNPEIEAPAIAGLPVWYVTAQVKKFQSGARGAHPDDLSGLRMRPMSKSLREESNDLADVAAYVVSLPVVEGEHLVEGDATRGKALYTPCIACHAVDGTGNQALNGPPLKQLDDWYMVSQINKFRAGIRGANPLDTTGMLMRPMSMTLPNEQAINDVVAYIRTLR